eukprot:2230774-Pyramimonas_sp.AAC.2
MQEGRWGVAEDHEQRVEQLVELRPATSVRQSSISEGKVLAGIADERIASTPSLDICDIVANGTAAIRTSLLCFSQPWVVKKEWTSFNH